MIEDWVYANFDVVKNAAWDEWTVCCPFCENDTKFHLYIAKNKPVAHCFKCGWSGTYFQLVKDVSGADSYVEIWSQIHSPLTMMGFQTVVQQLQERRHYPIQTDVLDDMPDWFQPYDGTLLKKSKQGQVVLQYALGRLSMEDVADYRLGYCTDISQPYVMRLIIPVERGYFQARAIFKAQSPKYINPTFPIEDRLFNFQALEHYKRVYVCEGAISAIAIGHNAVATLGANGATDGQRHRLVLSKVEEFVLVVEPEPVAKRMAADVAEYLSGYGKSVIMRTYSKGDPADGDSAYTEQPYGLAYLV